MQQGDLSCRQINFFGRSSQNRARAWGRKLPERGHASPGCGMCRADDIPPPLYFHVNVHGKRDVVLYKTLFRYSFRRMLWRHRKFHTCMREREKRERERERNYKKAQPVRAAYRCGILNSWNEHESPVRRRRCCATCISELTIRQI